MSDEERASDSQARTGAKANAPGEAVKMSLNLSPELAAEVRRLASERGSTVAEVIRRAIGTEKFIAKVVREDGKVLVEDKKGNVQRLVFR